MERLTARIEGVAVLDWNREGQYTPNELIDLLLERLAAYEDTCLTPEYITELLDDANAMHAELAVLKQEKAARENPAALTLDELRQMDGEPVWIEADHYGVYADVVQIVGKDEGEACVWFEINWHLQENGHNKTWMAYRNKPKED